MTRCKRCGYYWKEEGDRFPCCHFDEDLPNGWAPCEQDEDTYEN